MHGDDARQQQITSYNKRQAKGATVGEGERFSYILIYFILSAWYPRLFVVVFFPQQKVVFAPEKGGDRFALSPA